MSGVTLLLICLIGGEDNFSASLDWKVGVANSATSADLWALGVKSNGDLAADHLALSFAGVVDDGLVVWVVSMRAVHANNVKASSAELVDSLWRVGLWANGANDGSYAKLV